MLVYVYDLLLASASPESVAHTKDRVMTTFKRREMEKLSYFLGMHIERDLEVGVLRLGQRKYVLDVLARFNMIDANATQLPMVVGTRLQKAGKLLDDEGKVRYQDLVSCLLYFATCTRTESGVEIKPALAHRRFSAKEGSRWEGGMGDANGSYIL